MEKDKLEKLLNDVAEGTVKTAEALQILKTLPYDDIGIAKIDKHREIRTGHSEVIFCLNKTPKQVAQIVKKMTEYSKLIIGTKASPEHYEATKALVPEAKFDEDAGMIIVGEMPEPKSDKVIAIVTAGTADIPVAREAALTAQSYGHRVKEYYDVGVAGIHRLFDKLDEIREANVIIAVAGMEGALASVLGGLVDVPVIAVPTSTGYGSSQGGMAALLAMLNSCALGVSVMNIDNGFGAGYFACKINR